MRAALSSIEPRVARLAALADRPGDSDEARQRHRFMLLTGLTMSCGGLVWGVMALFFGLPGPSLIPFGYVAVTAVNFAVLARTKHFAPARTVQVFISLLLPFLFQWVLGGFVPSGAVMIWSMLALVCALSFESKQAAVRWLWFYLALTLFSGLIDARLRPPAAMGPQGFGPLSFAVNLATVSAMVFGLTTWFLYLRDLSNAELTRKNAELARSQQALVQSEKLAALGQLVAGVAHELNTPLGAIGASVGNITTALDETLDELPWTLAAATPEELLGLRALLREGASVRPALTSREERARRAEVQRELGARGIEDARTVARALVDIGVGERVDVHLPLLRAPSAEALLRVATNLASLRRNSGTIRTAADRAAKIVFALKRYAHPGAADGESIEARIEDNLETVLTLYGNSMKSGVELVRRFEDPGVVRAHHDELNQVWTNLVHNALQAMGYKGRLELSVARVDGRVVVQVIDSGPGISEAARGHVFEPFYTTKAPGEGSGLGLSISRDIVERHGGSIAVESQPGRTVFSVALPSGAG